jgi:hypothetical protein
VRIRGGPAVLILAATALGGCAGRAAPPPSAPAAPDAPGATAPERPVVREIVLEGVSSLTAKEVERAIRLRPGQKLRGSPAGVAGDLEIRYRLKGHLAPRVQATFDGATGRLTLRADEGRIREIAIEGVEGDGEARAREALGLETGAPLREKDLRAGLRRIDDQSGGALVAAEPPYEVDALDEGVRLRVLLARHRVRWRFRPRGPDLSPILNRVEGTTPGASVELTLYDASSYRHTTLHARAAYGFKSEQARWAVGARRPFGPGGKLVLGYEAHDLTDTDDAFRREHVEAGPGRPRVASVVDDYFRRRGHEAFAFVRPTPRAHVGVSFRAERHESMPTLTEDAVFFLSRRLRPNAPAGEGDMRSLLLAGRWSARGALYPGERSEQESFFQREPYGGPFTALQRLRADLSLEIAGGGLGGDFDFNRLLAHVRGARAVTGRHGVRGRALLGLTTGTPPPQRRLALGGHGTLRGYSVKEFTGEHAVLATAEWTYTPPGRWPGVIAFYDGGAAWTDGVPGSGWRDDVGIGLEWPGGRGWLRVDLGYALRPEPGRDRARVHAVLYLPF